MQKERTHARTHARKNAPFTERPQKCRREHGRRHSEIFCSAEKIDVARNDDDKDTEDEEEEEEKKKKTKTKVEKQLLKEKFIRLVRRKLIENATFRRAFVNANEYNKIAQSVRVAFREENDDEDDEEKEKMLRFLDSKSHFLFVIDKVVGQKSDEDDDDEDVHVNLTEPLETWLRVKNYHRNKFKKLGENAAATIKEKQKAKREAKERVNKARMERKRKRRKRRNEKRGERKYHVDLEYYRHKGTCLDWVNTGTCRFGSECTYAHDEEAKGKLIEAGATSRGENGSRARIVGEYADAKQKKRKREDVLLGDFDDDDDDDDKDDTIVPGFLKAQMKKSSKHEGQRGRETNFIDSLRGNCSKRR